MLTASLRRLLPLRVHSQLPCPTLEVTEVTTVVQCSWKTELHRHASTLAFGDEQPGLSVDDPQLWDRMLWAAELPLPCFLQPSLSLPPGRRNCVCGKLIYSRKGIRTRIQRELEGFPLEDSVFHRSWQTEVMSWLTGTAHLMPDWGAMRLQRLRTSLCWGMRPTSWTQLSSQQFCLKKCP